MTELFTLFHIFIVNVLYSFIFLFHFYINGKMEDLLGQPYTFAGAPGDS